MIRESEESCKVSVIVPIYNSEQWLRECLDSIISQTLKEIEIICVNDGSDDGSPEIIREYASADNRIKVVDQENKGLSDARNAGISVASGKYLYYIDSDDSLVEDAQEVLYHAMEEKGLDVVSFNAHSFADGEDLEEAAEKENKTYFGRELDDGFEGTGIELLADLTEGSKYVSTVFLLMLRRSFAMENGLSFVSGILHEDEAYTIEAYLKAKKAGCVDLFLYNRRVRQNSIMTQKVRFRNAYGTYRACKHIESVIKETEIPERYVPSVLSHLTRLQKSAVYKYRKCSVEEKDKLKELPLAERVELQQFLIYPAEIETRAVRLKKENSKLKKEQSAAQDPKEGLLSRIFKK